MLTNTFEYHVQQTEGGVEYWLARDLQHLLEYTEWRNFLMVVGKAKTACEISGNSVSDHFVEVNKMVDLGSGSKREIADIMLTRYACYLIAQNGDSKKVPIAFAQTYFAIQTRKAEIIEQRIQEQERVSARKKLWMVPANRPLADFAPTIILKAKDFATEITIHNTREHAMSTESAISEEHVTNNQAVRKTLIERGIRPESLPPSEDTKKLERRISSQEKESLQTSDSLTNKNA